jgi:hypothetical protein
VLFLLLAQLALGLRLVDAASRCRAACAASVGSSYSLSFSRVPLQDRAPQVGLFVDGEFAGGIATTCRHSSSSSSGSSGSVSNAQKRSRQPYYGRPAGHLSPAGLSGLPTNEHECRRPVWCCPSTTCSSSTEDPGRNGGACGPQTTTQAHEAADPNDEAHPAPWWSGVLPRGRELQHQACPWQQPLPPACCTAKHVTERRSRSHGGLGCCLGGGSRRPRMTLVAAPPPRVGGRGLALFETRGGADQNVVAPFTRPDYGGECTSLGQRRGWREDSSHCGSSNPCCEKWPLPLPGKPFALRAVRRGRVPPAIAFPYSMGRRAARKILGGLFRGRKRIYIYIYINIYNSYDISNESM